MNDITVRDVIKTTFSDVLVEAIPDEAKRNRFIAGLAVAMLDNHKLFDLVESSKKCQTDMISNILQVAGMDLSPAPAAQHVAFVPFMGDNKSIALIPMFKAYVLLARRQGINIQTSVVYEDDDFSIDMGHPKRIKHIPGKVRSVPIGYYILATKNDLLINVDYMSEEQAQNFYKNNIKTNHKMWEANFEQMALKTLIRRIAKRIGLEHDQSGIDRLLEVERIADERIEKKSKKIAPVPVGEIGEVVEDKQVVEDVAGQSTAEAGEIDEVF